MKFSSNFWKKSALLFLGLLLLSLAALVNEEFLTLEKCRVTFHSPLTIFSFETSFKVNYPYVKTILTVILIIPVLSLSVLFFAFPKVRSVCKNFLNRERKLIADIVLLFIFSMVILSIGSARALVYYFFSISGFIATFLAFWPKSLRMAEKIGPRLGSNFYWIKERNFLVLMFMFAFLMTNLISFFVFQHQPHGPTGTAHIFHAKIFATGQLFLPSHPLKEFFEFPVDVIINNGKWYTHFPPGHTFFMMLGNLAGMPWIINPLFGAISVVVFYYLGKEIYDEKTGRLAALLGLLSPFLIFMSSEFYNHATSLLFCSLFILFFVKVVKVGKWSYALLAGVCLGVVLMTRPLTALAVSLPFAVYASWLLFRFRKKYMLQFFLMFLVVIQFLSIQLLFNYYTNDSPWVFGYALTQKMYFASSLWDAILHAVRRIKSLNKSLFELPIPSLIFILILFLSKAKNKWDYLLMSALLSGIVAYSFWWHGGFLFGPRYLYYSVGILVVLSARGIQRIPEVVNDVLKLKISYLKTNRIVFVALGLCFFMALLFRWYPMVKFYSSDIWDWSINTEMLKTIKKKNIKHAVIFVKGGQLYRSVFLENSIDIDNSDIIYVRDLGLKNTLLMNYYPNRAYFHADEFEIRKISNSSE